jgi:hypothetical protein
VLISGPERSIEVRRGARVEVTAGTGQGLTRTTSAPSPQTPFENGGYRLYGVSGDIEVRVTRDGYQEQQKSLQVTGHQRLDFDLILSRPRDQVAGTYTLTVAAAAECRVSLPEEAGTRKYTAVLRQDGPRLTATLEGATFALVTGRPLNSFAGAVEPNRVVFHLNEFYEYYNYLPDVLEQLTTPTFLAISGSAVTTITSSGLTGTLDGPIETLQLTSSGRYQRIAACDSPAHQFVLSR